MSKPEKFLTRWSQRKLAKSESAALERENLAAQDERKDDKTPPPAQHIASATGSDSRSFDIASLPAIESINASTDVTAFLRPGVPPELSRAALRRAWSADPAIRDFVGLVENGWDFNDPNAMPGFGPIEPAEAARLAVQMLGELPAVEAEAAVDTAKNAAFENGFPRGSPAAELRESNQSRHGGEMGPAEQSDGQQNAENVAAQKRSDL